MVNNFLTTLYEISGLVVLKSDLSHLDNLFDLTIEKTNQIMKVKNSSLMLIDEEERVLTIKAARGLDKELIKKIRVKIGDGISGWVGEKGEPLLIPDIEKDSRFRQRSKEKYITRSLLSVPLKIRGITIGVLNVNNKISGRSFEKKDLEFLSIIANQVAVAIENARLHSQVMKFNQELQSQLIQSEKMAALGNMAGEIAHELNNPLSGIQGYGQILLPRITDVQDKSDLERILKSVSQCKQIINRLLQFARPAKPSFTPTKLKEAVEETLALASPQLKKKGIKVVVDFSPDISSINADVNQLQQVFLNLIINAFHAMSEGGVLSISGRQEEKEAVLEFNDTGCGISENNLSKIFNPYFTTKAGASGTGLGLSISYRIIENHGGHISVKSKEGEGATFTIRLPLDH